MKTRETTLGDNSEERKRTPLFRGPIRYFPAALAGVARVCQIGNDKHNPGEEMHHARGKSTDHADCIVRHLLDLDQRGGLDENGIPQVDYIAWRALALAQEWHERNSGAPLAPGARLPTPVFETKVFAASGSCGGQGCGNGACSDCAVYSL